MNISLFILESKKIYEWKILAEDKNNNNKDQQNPRFIIAHFTPSKPLNDLFFDKDGSIIDMKNTKGDLFVLDGNENSSFVYCLEKCQVSSLKIKQEEKMPFLNFKLTASNLVPQNKIIKICCGTSHVIALSNKGVVFSWGSSQMGRLGQGKTNDITAPQLVISSIFD